MWVAAYGQPLLYAYEVATRRHDDPESISLDKFGNLHAAGIWSNGQTIWVADYSDRRVYAYQLQGSPLTLKGQRITLRETNKEFNLASANGDAVGIWSDGETMWVADAEEDRVFAYQLDGGSRQANKEFNLSGGNARATGISSNGETIWVADPDDDKLYAYRLTEGDSFGDREPAKDIDLASENGAPIGIWSDGVNMWVADVLADKIFGYSSPYLSATEE